MGKAVLIIIAGTIVVLAMFNMGMLGTLDRGTETSVEQFAQKQSRLIAASMVNMSISRLSDDASYRQTTVASKDFFNGTAYYIVKDTVYEGTDVVKISADGHFFGDVTTVTAFVVPPEPSMHPFLRYAIIGKSEVKFNDKDIIVRNGTSDPTLNANVHSNTQVVINALNTTIHGFVTSPTMPSVDASAQIIPNSNPDGLAPVHTAPAVNIPSLTDAQFDSMKAEAETWSSPSISGNLTLGTKENPRILFRSGTLEINNTNITGPTANTPGYGIIIATDEVLLKGSFLQQTRDPDNSEVMIISKYKILGGEDDKTIDATLYGKNEINLKPRTLVRGSLISGDYIVRLDAPGIIVEYKPPAVGIAEWVFGQNTNAPTTRLAVVQWIE
jgi:hypothetical protein